MKRKTRDDDPDPFIRALGLARMGDPAGVHEMMYIFGNLCRELTVLGGPIVGAPPLDPIILARMASIGKDCASLAEFADGFVHGTKAKSKS